METHARQIPMGEFIKELRIYPTAYILAGPELFGVGKGSQQKTGLSLALCSVLARNSLWYSSQSYHLPEFEIDDPSQTSLCPDAQSLTLTSSAQGCQSAGESLTFKMPEGTNFSVAGLPSFQGNFFAAVKIALIRNQKTG